MKGIANTEKPMPITHAPSLLSNIAHINTRIISRNRAITGIESIQRLDPLNTITPMLVRNKPIEKAAETASRYQNCLGK